MIYLSAQPASFYFLWQIELMLFNFDRMGITSQEIHVLIGCDQHLGLPLIFKEFIEKNTLAKFFVYEDTRLKRRYESSYYLVKPDATIIGTGILSGNSSQTEQFQSNIKNYRWLPIVQLNFNYRF